MNRIVTLAVAGLIAVAGGAYVLSQQGGPGPSLAAAQAQDAEVDTSMVEEMALGQEDAPVTVIEYASFTCPHCATFHDTVFEQIKENYVDTGKVRFVYREVYFDRFGLWAGMVARCGGEDRYFGVVDLIYENQQDWIGQGQPAEIAENLRRLGRTAGMSDEQLDTCLNDAEKAQAMVAAYEQNAEADDVRSTPTFIIDGEKYSNMGYDEFSSVLDEKLGS